MSQGFLEAAQAILPGFLALVFAGSLCRSRLSRREEVVEDWVQDALGPEEPRIGVASMLLVSLESDLSPDSGFEAMGAEGFFWAQAYPEISRALSAFGAEFGAPNQARIEAFFGRTRSDPTHRQSALEAAVRIWELLLEHPEVRMGEVRFRILVGTGELLTVPFPTSQGIRFQSFGEVLESFHETLSNLPEGRIFLEGNPALAQETYQLSPAPGGSFIEGRSSLEEPPPEPPLSRSLP